MSVCVRACDACFLNVLDLLQDKHLVQQDLRSAHLQALEQEGKRAERLALTSFNQSLVCRTQAWHTHSMLCDVCSVLMQINIFKGETLFSKIRDVCIIHNVCFKGK